jgi:hypothetical protein
MTARRALVWLLCAAFAGCASEGGVTGTGISASVTGSINWIQPPQAPAPPPFPIRVTIAEAPAVTTVAAADGTFALEGRFSGAVTVVFADDAGAAAIGSLALEIPAGSVTLLENVAIDPSAPLEDRVRPLAVRQLDIVGHLDLAECAAGGATLLVSDNARPPRQILVALSADTEIVARDGTPLDCAALREGVRLGIEGFLRRDTQTLDATRVVVTPPPLPPPGEPRRERVRGLVLATDCARGELVVEQPHDGEASVRVIRLTEETELRCGIDPSRACDCAAIAGGDGVQGSGTIFPRRPGQVIADTLTVTTVPRLTLLGTLERADCGGGALAVRVATPGDRVVRVALSRGTAIQCGRRACPCTALGTGHRLRLEGTLRSAEPPVLDAVTITVLARTRAGTSP